MIEVLDLYFSHSMQEKQVCSCLPNVFNSKLLILFLGVFFWNSVALDQFTWSKEPNTIVPWNLIAGVFFSNICLLLKLI